MDGVGGFFFWGRGNVKEKNTWSYLEKQNDAFLEKWMILQLKPIIDSP